MLQMVEVVNTQVLMIPLRGEGLETISNYMQISIALLKNIHIWKY